MLNEHQQRVLIVKIYKRRILGMTPIENAIDLCGGPAKAATAIGCSVQAVCFWRDARRRLPAEAATVLEQATAGAVMRWDLRPHDWWRIWPELRQRSDAPPVPSAPPGIDQP